MIELEVVGDHAHIIPLGDLHIGHQTCQYNKIEEIIEYIEGKEDCWVIGVGDYIDAGMVERTPGKSRHEQDLKTNEAFETAVQYLERIEDKIITLLDGHHEDRITRTTGLNPTRMMSHLLGVDYDEWVFYDQINVGGKQTYKILAKHGNTSAKTLQGKLKACMDLGQIYNADAYIYAHSHELAAVSSLNFDIVENQKIKNKRWFVLTGHFLGYESTYAEEKEMKPGKTGVAKIELFKDRFDTHVKI